MSTRVYVNGYWMTYTEKGEEALKTEKQQNQKSLNIIILSAAPKSKATKSIIIAGENRGHKITVLDPAYLYLLISESESGYDRVYDGYDKNDKPVRIKAKNIDAVISRIGNNLSYGTSVLHHFRYNLGIFTTQSPEGILTASDKLLSLQKISASKIRVPKTIYADNGVHLDFMIDKIGGLPAISKLLKGSQGIGVIPLESKLQTNATMQSFYKSGNKTIIQQYIEGGAKDIRAIVIDGEVISAMERTAPKGDLRANISLGGSGRKIELTEKEIDMCIEASNACGLRVSGVDLMRGNNGKTYCIEVNGNYGYKIEEVTKDDISTPLIKYCERQYKKGNFSKDALVQSIRDTKALIMKFNDTYSTPKEINGTTEIDILLERFDKELNIFKTL